MATNETVNILVVDDLPDKLLSLEALLSSPGQHVVTALSGREALRRLLEHDFAVILLDINMPDMDGFETARLIRQRKQTAHTPIIFVTAFGDEAQTAQGYSLGAVDYIFAPVVPEILRTKVGVFVDLYRKTEQVRRQADERVALAREQAARVAAEENTRRSSFLAEVTSVLASSLDYETIIRSFLRRLVPHFADLAGVMLVAEPGQAWQCELAWILHPPQDIETFRDQGPDAHYGSLWPVLERVRDAGEGEWIEDLALVCPLLSDEANPASETLGLTGSAFLLPLRARGHTLGVLTVVRGESGRRFSPAEQGYAEELAGRAAMAIDNARLYREVQEADRRKNDFLAMLAHELRNPLAPIRSAVYILRKIGSTEPQARWAQDVIERQLNQMVRLVDDLLDVSRITRGKIVLQIGRVDLAAVVDSAVETARPLIEAAGHQLTVNLPAEPVVVQGDLTRLAQVLGNLLNNSAKYTEKGGRISITVRRQGAQAVVQVCDSGIGIPPDMLPHVFEMFAQVDRSVGRSQGGLGIGLTLVKSLVEMHGGTITAASAGPGQGSEFTVSLPLAPATADSAPPPPQEKDAGLKASDRRILVVDDNVDSAEAMAMMLQMAGNEVRMSHDGPSALAEAANFRPDVVLLDIGLPGMDGYEVARRLRALPHLQQALLIAQTGWGQADDRRRAREAGFDHHLVKPVELSALHELIAGLNRGNGTTQASDHSCPV
jgi:signal transduction histidine kinase